MISYEGRLIVLDRRLCLQIVEKESSPGDQSPEEDDHWEELLPGGFVTGSQAMWPSQQSWAHVSNAASTGWTSRGAQPFTDCRRSHPYQYVTIIYISLCSRFTQFIIFYVTVLQWIAAS